MCPSVVLKRPERWSWLRWRAAIPICAKSISHRLMRAQQLEKLKEYRRKRDFRKTLEPSGADAAAEAGCLYVMHKHQASHDHFDLRLELDGVLRSWAIPKGPSLEPGERRLAVEVEDHPIEYGGFEGTIPKGEYGGGTIMLWDAGEWAVKGKHTRDQIDFVLRGTKLKGAWTLVRTRGRGKESKNWLLIKRSDKNGVKLKVDDTSVASGRTMKEIAADQDNRWLQHQTSVAPASKSLKGAKPKPPPRPPQPQLATATSTPPRGKEWLHEIKYDGYRLMAWVEKGKVSLYTRNGKDWSHRFPEIKNSLAQLEGNALIDGEVAIASREGVTSFRQLQEALSAGRTRRLSYHCFDLLYLDGYDLTDVPLRQRKEALATFFQSSGLVDDERVFYSDHILGKGREFYEECCQIGLEGIVSKRADADYQSGRNKRWLKTKCSSHQEFVVGGYTKPGGVRSGFGALLLGAFVDEKFHYAGRVGTGFSTAQLKDLHGRLQRLLRKSKPFASEVPDTATVSWVKPELVVEVEYTERTRDGRLRHPTFRGLREDRDASEIVLRPGPPTQDAGAKTMRTTTKQEESKVAGVTITHPERIVYPQQGVTKIGLARYYEAVSEWILPQLARRPLALLRCPQGRNEQCFFQKHPGSTFDKSVPRIGISEKDGSNDYVYIESTRDLIHLVQMGTMELHPWGCRIDDVEHPDLMVFDLDPAPDVSWKNIIGAARGLRDRLEDLGLQSFLRTTGGKGVHLVVPLQPKANWEEVKDFSRAVSQRHAEDDPRRLTTNSAKAKRQGKVFIDYLRNGRGNTAVAAYSTRARPGAPVAVPVKWSELDAALRPDRYTVDNLFRRLRALKRDPWESFEQSRKPLTAKMRQAVGLKT